MIVDTTEDELMILVDCTQCGRRELRGYRSVAVVNTPTGIELSWACRACEHPHREPVAQSAEPPHPSLIAA